MSVNNPNFPKKPETKDPIITKASELPEDNQDVKTNVDNVFLGLDADEAQRTEAKLRAQAQAEETGQLNLPDMPQKPIIQELPKTENDMLMARIRAMEAELFMLKNGRNGVKVTEKPAKQIVLDFTKLSEKDVFNMDIPFEVVEHDMPDYIKVELKDPNYVPRWVNKNPRRIGPMKSQGWTFVTKDDLAGKLKIDLDIDENGMFRFDDVILMKCEKAKYYGMLRRNHERALAQVNPKQAHAAAKAQVQRDLSSTSDGAGEYQKYTSLGKLEVYVPGQDGI